MRVSQELTNSNELADLNYPLAYLEFIAGCLVRQRHAVARIKGAPCYDDTKRKRLAALVRVLQQGVPPLTFAIAKNVAGHADTLSHDCGEKENWRWAGDIGIHFQQGSSFAYKGRLLAAIVRLIRPLQILELGTAYGMSGMFILSQLRELGGDGRLTTVESSEPQYSMARTALETRFGQMVSCRQLDISQHLGDLARSLGSLDFVFHDAGHVGANYMADFHAMEPYLARGSVMLWDDIHWSNPAVADQLGCYHAWRKIVSHSRVLEAFELDGQIGLLQLA